jgi:hypothetical protein
MTEETEAAQQPAVLEAVAQAVADRVRQILTDAHGRFVAGEDSVSYQLGHLEGCMKLEGDPSDRETVRTTATRWHEQMALAHFNGAMLGMQALCRKAYAMEVEDDLRRREARPSAQDQLIDDMTVSWAHLVGLLRDAQAQRDRLANEALKLEDRATKAELRLTALETDHDDTDGEETRTFQLWSALGYGCYGRGCTTCFCECQEPDHMAKLLDGAVKDLETLLASPIPVQSRREELLRRPAAALDAVRAERERQVKLRGAENKARTSA